MKKRPIVLFIIASFFILFACGKSSDNPISGDTGAADANLTSATMIDSILVEPVVIYEETIDDLTADNGVNIGSDSDRRETTDEGVRFYAGEGENPFLLLKKGLNEANGVKNMNQAFCMRFQPSAKDFGVMLSASGKVGITIGEDSAPLVFVLEHDYMEPLNGDLKIEPNQWYRALVAINPQGVLRGAIWKDGDESDAAQFCVDASQFNDDAYQNQSWQVFIGFQGEATFTISDYEYYTFSDYLDMN